MSACPTLCREVLVRYSVPLGPLHALSGWPDPIKKNIVHSSYGPFPLLRPPPTIPLERFRASPEPSITIPRQTQIHLWLEQSRVSDASFIATWIVRVSVLIINTHRRRPSLAVVNPNSSTWHLTCFPIPHSRRVHLKSVLPGPPFSQSSIHPRYRREFCLLLGHHR